MRTFLSVMEIRREDDDELLGYLVPVGADWQPTTVFHAPLADPTSEEEAEDILRREGLTALSDPWWVEEAGEWREVRLQEAEPYRIRVRWADPTIEQPAHGHWVDLREQRVRR
ncbi:hypothetical protein ACFQ1S_21005 [Kibdelosporangium lantanae]|uniref:Uncharacterized protein n=1 Tax=Kibdelosporangium lantanae TaxID=1497396 RepID=A0ABW3MAN7_9PSEU